MEGNTVSILVGRSRRQDRKRRDGGAGGPRAKSRRRFTAAYKLRILRQADLAVAEGPGALETLLDREGLYSSHLAQWRKRQRDGGLEKARRGRKPSNRQALLRENRKVKKLLAHLEAKLRETALLINPAWGRDRGIFGHGAGFLRRRLLDLAENARTSR
jgi:transposase-like protein